MHHSSCLPQFLHLQAREGLGPHLTAGTELVLHSWGVQDLMMAMEPATLSFLRRDQLLWYQPVNLEHRSSLSFPTSSRSAGVFHFSPLSQCREREFKLFFPQTCSYLMKSQEQMPLQSFLDCGPSSRSAFWWTSRAVLSLALRWRAAVQVTHVASSEKLYLG